MNETYSLVAVDLKECEFCNIRCELICVCCEVLVCDDCCVFCVQCEQPVCEGCYEEDLCCLVRPWGEKTEKFLKDYYHNKYVDGELSYFLGNDLKYGVEHRNQAIKSAIAHFVDNFDAEALTSYKSVFVKDYFPSITK